MGGLVCECVGGEGLCDVDDVECNVCIVMLCNIGV